MRNNYTLHYIYNNLNDPEAEFIDEKLFQPENSSGYREVFLFLDARLAEVSDHLVEKLISISDELMRGK